MQRERQGRNDLFAMGDPFGNFRGFGLLPSLFGGRDPFDDSLFALPFGSMFESSRYDPPVLLAGTSCRPTEGEKEDVQTGDEKSDHQNNIGSSKEPSAEHPDERENKSVNYRSDHNRTEGAKPQNRSSIFQTCKATYGGMYGAYYTSTRSRRTGGDGV